MANLSHDATTFLVLFARIGAILMLLPVFSEESIPGQIRLLMALGFTAGLWALLAPAIPSEAGDSGALLAILVAELAVGIAIGAIVRLMFQAASMAGAIISTQIGLASVLVFDAGQGGQAPLLSKLVSLAAALVCMGLGVHHLWIEAMVRSYALFPVGVLPPIGDFAALAVASAVQATRLAVSLAAPLIVYGIVFNVALALSSRMAGAIQVFFIAQPLNLLLGLGLLAGTIGTILATFAETLASQLRSGWI
jgi:flagellar biosynthetic protein FliR